MSKNAIRNFAGKRYLYEKPFSRKTEAVAYANRKRKQGYLARITQGIDKQGKKYYMVWLRGGKGFGYTG